MLKSFFTQLLLFSCLISGVLSTHFRFGIITWQQTSGTQRTFSFNIQTAWRRTYFTPNPNVGDLVTGASTFYLYSGSSGTNFAMTVNSIDTTNDWFIATQDISGTYSSDGTYYPYFNGCCRISSLLNDHDGNWQVKSMVKVVSYAGRLSMKSTVVPITTLILNQAATFQLGIIKFNNEALRYRLATSQEASNDNSYVQPSGLSVSFSTGVISWTPTTAGLWTTQVVVLGYTNSSTPSSSSDTTGLETAMYIDWILQVATDGTNVCKRFCTNAVSVCTSDSDCNGCTLTTHTPFCVPKTYPYWVSANINGVTQTLARNGSISLSATATYGQKFYINITAADTQADNYVTIATSAIPTGASTYLPSSSNPTTAMFTWTPSATDSASVVCFSATNSFYNSIPGSLCITITLSAGSLSASGLGLTYAVAGDLTYINVTNSASRTHSLSMAGYTYGNSYSGTVSEIGSTTSYTGYYTIPVSDVYALTISDTTSGLTVYPQPVYSTLLVVPGITNPYASVPYDSGTTGTSGGYGNATVTFYMIAYDWYSNRQTLKRTDNFTISVVAGKWNISYPMVWTAASDGTYYYNVSYVVPGTVSQNYYTVNIYYSNSSIPSKWRVQSFNCSIATTSFSISYPSDIEFTAGDKVKVNFTVTGVTDGTSASKTFGVLVNGVAGSVVNLGSGSYQVVGPVVTKAESYQYPNNIILTSPSLNSNGLATMDFTVNPAAPYGPNCTLAAYKSTANFRELTAGTTVQMLITLYDIYGNRVYNASYAIPYSMTPAAGSATSGQAVASTSSTGLYTFNLNGTTAGTLTLSATVSGMNIANTPLTIKVFPGAFSTIKSQMSGTYSTVSAGDSNFFTIIAKDAYDNSRAGYDDIFQIHDFTYTDNSVQHNGTMNWAQTGSTGYYVFVYSATKAGKYHVNVKVRATGADGDSYNTYWDNYITVDPGVAVASNSMIIQPGSDVNGLSQNTAGLFVIQARDAYNNTIPETRDGLFVAAVAKITSPGSTYYVASFCSPYSSTCAKTQTSFYSKFKFQSLDTSSSSSNTSKLSTFESGYSSQGFWRMSYVVPQTSTSVGTYTVSIYYANSTERTSSSENASVTVARSSTVLVSSFTATSFITSSATTDDNPWPAIVGAACGSVFFMGVAYGAWRLSRYRPKYRAERERAEEAENILQEINDEAYLPGARDYMAVGGATVTKNPLHEVYAQHMTEMTQLGNIANPTKELAEQQKMNGNSTRNLLSEE